MDGVSGRQTRLRGMCASGGSGLLVLVLLVLCCLQTWSWSSGWRGVSSARCALQMRATSPPQSKLERAKAKFEGRRPFLSPNEEENLDQDYADLRAAMAEFEAEQGGSGIAKVGDVVEGTVLDFDEIGALVNIGGKAAAHLPAGEMSLSPVADPRSMVQVGQRLTVKVVGMWNGYVPVVSLKADAIRAAWKQVLVLKERDEPLQVQVSEAFKAGAMCRVLGLQAFMPATHAVSALTPELKGQTITVKILDANDRDGRFVVSEKRCLATDSTLQPGQVLTATVSGFRDYGVFVELPGQLSGLLHVSQISNVRIDVPVASLFQLGQAIKVMVIDHERSSGKVALSTKTLELNPGDMLTDAARVFEHAEATAAAHMQRLQMLRADSLSSVDEPDEYEEQGLEGEVEDYSESNADGQRESEGQGEAAAEATGDASSPATEPDSLASPATS